MERRVRTKVDRQCSVAFGNEPLRIRGSADCLSPVPPCIRGCVPIDLLEITRGEYDRHNRVGLRVLDYWH